MADMRITKYLFRLNIGYKDISLLTDIELKRIMRGTIGKWAKLVGDRGIGTILYLIHKDKIYFQSMIKPVHIDSIEQVVTINNGTELEFRVRLPADISYIESIYSKTGADKELTDQELYLFYIKDILKENGMSLVRSRMRILKKDDDLNPTLTLTLFQCGEFTVQAKVEDVDRFKKAYAYGIGAYRSLGFGMIYVNIQ